MGPEFFRRRSPLPEGWQYDLPAGEIATAAQLAEYHRRKRRQNWYQLLWFFGFLPTAVWIGMNYIPDGILRIVYIIAVAIAGVFLGIISGRNFRCPVCETPIETSRRTSRWGISPERRAALYGKYNWCESCGTRFEKYPGAIYPPETDSDDPENDDDDRGLGIL